MIAETGRTLMSDVTYQVTCSRCATATVTLTTDTDLAEAYSDGYDADAATEALTDLAWTVRGDITDLEAVTVLCPDCPPCEEVGHAWEEVEDGIVILETRLRCRVCNLAPHTPERRWLPEIEALDISISAGPNHPGHRGGGASV